MTVNSKLTLANTDTETIDSLVVSASQDAGGYVISRQNNLELHLGSDTSRLSYLIITYFRET